MPSAVKFSKALIFGNIVGTFHFIIANLAIFLGQFTPILRSFDPYGKYPGINFVRWVLDAPILPLFSWFDRTAGDDFLYTMIVTEFLILAGSFVYGGIAYALTRAISFLIDEGR